MTSFMKHPKDNSSSQLADICCLGQSGPLRLCVTYGIKDRIFPYASVIRHILKPDTFDIIYGGI